MPFKQIDVHAHYWTDHYLDMFVSLGKTITSGLRIGAAGGAELDAVRSPTFTGHSGHMRNESGSERSSESWYRV